MKTHPAPHQSSLLSFIILLCILVPGCAAGDNERKPLHAISNIIAEEQELTAKREFKGAFSNGMKGDSIFFLISADGRRLEELTFKGYWRCSGRLEQITVGPETAFAIKDGKVSGHITEPPGGGSTAWRFELEAKLGKDQASGIFRMNINDLGCDTYQLKWTAAAK